MNCYYENITRNSLSSRISEQCVYILKERIRLSSEKDRVQKKRSLLMGITFVFLIFTPFCIFETTCIWSSEIAWIPERKILFQEYIDSLHR